LAAATLSTGLLCGGAMAELYKVSSIAPGMSPFVVNTAISKVVNTHVDGVEFQVRVTGAATKHMVDAANGDVDFLFGSPTINWLLAEQIGPYHYVTRADRGIESLNDLRGKKVFAGPPGGAAKGVVLRAIEQTTGIKAEEMDVQSFGFDAAIQAFRMTRSMSSFCRQTCPRPRCSSSR
jgi:TRAP-type uncharacterized transport system substrate-binding protein